MNESVGFSRVQQHKNMSKLFLFEKLYICLLFVYSVQAAEAEKDVKYPLKPTHKVAMMRNIEKMLLSALNSEDEVRKEVLVEMECFKENSILNGTV